MAPKEAYRMTWISRLFRRKSEQASTVEKGDPDPEITPGAEGDNEMFGLQFILDSGESKTFTALPLKIGRGEQNDVKLNDETVSTDHAQVYYDEQVRDICIIDLDSLNGLFIGDQPTRKNILYDGVKIRLGRVQLTFRDTGYIHPT
jgi:hypothetical protein